MPWLIVYEAAGVPLLLLGILAAADWWRRRNVMR